MHLGCKLWADSGHCLELRHARRAQTVQVRKSLPERRPADPAQARQILEQRLADLPERRSALYVLAKRCASSRSRCSSCRPGWLSGKMRGGRPSAKTIVSSFSPARPTAAGQIQGANALRAAPTWPTPPSITTKSGNGRPSPSAAGTAGPPPPPSPGNRRCR